VTFLNAGPGDWLGVWSRGRPPGCPPACADRVVQERVTVALRPDFDGEKMHRSHVSPDTLSPEQRSEVRRLQERFGPDAEKAVLARSQALAALRSSYAADRGALLSREQDESIREAAKRHVADARNGAGQRYFSLIEARQRQIDLDHLESLQNSLTREVAGLFHEGTRFSASHVTARSLASPFDWPPMAQPPDPSVASAYAPPFDEPWDRTSISEASGDGRVTENTPYLDAQWGRIGSRLAARNHDASDSDQINVFHQNGFMVPYQVPSTGPLQVRAELICLLCRHRISTSDEWGWSNFHGQTKSALVLSVFWDHDGEPTSEIFEQSFVPGLNSSGDGESSPGMVVQVDPGESRTVDFYTDVAFPAGKTVWVYVGISDFVWVILNDVSIDVSLDSAWQLSSLTVSAL
jgi:hypothetical protein